LDPNETKQDVAKFLLFYLLKKKKYSTSDKWLEKSNVEKMKNTFKLTLIFG
jgi:hypothetical protein